MRLICMLFLTATALLADNVITISDDDFANGDWAAEKIADTTSGQSASFTAAQDASGDPAWHITHTYTDGSITVGHRYTPTPLSPSTTGRIISLDFSYDLAHLNPPTGQAVAVGPLLFQNNSYYVAPSADVFDAALTTFTATGLTADNFTRIAGAGPDAPDFSVTAADLQLGFYSRNSGSGTRSLLVDNFAVSASLVAPVSVVGMTPSGAVPDDVSQLQLQFSGPIDATDANSSATYPFLDLGPDREPGGGDDRSILLSPTYDANNNRVDLLITDQNEVVLQNWNELDWRNGGAGNWQLENGNSSVKQYTNGNTTFYVSDFDFINQQFTGRIAVETTSDDDYIGLGFAIQTSNSLPDNFYLLSWKQGNQSGGEAGLKLLKCEGFATKSVGSVDSLIWDGETGSGMTKLAEDISSANNSKGWQDNVPYDFSVRYESNGTITILVKRVSDGAVMWDMTYTDPSPLGVGKVGFMNYSQSHVRYSGLQQADFIPEGRYQLTAQVGTPGLRDLNGVPLDGNNDGVTGDDFVDYLVIDQTPPTFVDSVVDHDAGTITLTFADLVGMDPTTVENTANYELFASGGDGTFGDGNETDASSLISAINFDSASQTATITLSSSLNTEAYQFTAKSPGIADYAGLELTTGDQIITTIPPDLQLTATNLTEVVVGWGQQVAVSWTARNVGGLPANAAWADAVYLSSDNVLDDQDTLIHSEAIGNDAPLAPDAEYARAPAVTIPSAVAGDYFLILAVDHLDDQGEFNEGADNEATFAITIREAVGIELADPASFTATDVTTFSLQLSDLIANGPANDAALFQLLDLGADRAPGGGDDSTIAATPTYNDGNQIALALDDPTALPEGVYQLTAIIDRPGGNLTITDVIGDDDFFGFGNGTIGDEIPEIDVDKRDPEDPLFTDHDSRLVAPNDVAWSHDLSTQIRPTDLINSASVSFPIAGIQDGNATLPNIDDRLFIEGEEVPAAFDSLDQGAKGTALVSFDLTPTMLATFATDRVLNIELIGGETAAGNLDSYFIDYATATVDITQPTTGLTDLAGVPLDGDGDGAVGGDLVATITVDKTAPVAAAATATTSQILVTFNEVGGLDPTTAAAVANYQLASVSSSRADLSSQLVDASLDMATSTVTLTVTPSLPIGDYELTVKNTVTDLAGNALLNGDQLFPLSIVASGLTGITLADVPLADGTIIRRSGTLAAEFDNPAIIQQTELYVNDQLLVTDTDGGNGFSTNLNVPALGLGPATLKAVATTIQGITAELTVTVDVIPNQAPVINLPTNQQGTEHAAYTVTITASDPENHTITYSLDSAPSGADIDASSGLLSWTPTEADGGTDASFTVRATDNGEGNKSSTATFTVAVSEDDQPPTLSPTAQTVVEGNSLGYTIPGSDADVPANALTWSLVNDNLPGATIDPDSGLLQWTPPGTLTETETFTATVRAEEQSAGALAAEASFTVTFIKQQTLTTAANPVEGGTITGADTYDWNSLVPITATAADGFAFTGWTGDGINNPASSTTTVLMNQDRTVTANFAESFDLSATITPLDKGTVEGLGPIADGATATLTAVPVHGYRFVQWTGDFADNFANPGTTAAITADTTVDAEFEFFFGDLTVSEVTIPATVNGGEPTTVSWRVTNSGQLPVSGQLIDRIRLNTVDDIASATTATNTTPLTINLAPTESIVRSAQILPQPDQIGDLYVFVQVNTAAGIDEADATANNQSTGALTTVQAVDLNTGTPTTTTTAPAFGGSLQVAWTVTNDGNIPSFANWSDRIELVSLDGQQSLQLFPENPNGLKNASPIAPATSYNRDVTVQLPLNPLFPPGDYRLRVTADANAEQPEANEANNIATSTIINFANPPLPDLTPTNHLIPASGEAGEEVTITWDVLNAGAADATGSWTETLWLSTDVNLGNDVLLGSFTRTDTIAPAASATRTETVTIPADSPVGDLHVIAQIDPNGELIESDETNNNPAAGDQITVAARLVLWVPTHVINESSGPMTARLNRSGGLDTAVTIDLTADDDSEATFPATVSLAAGQSGTTFQIQPNRDGELDGDVTIVISASAPGLLGDSIDLTVNNSDLPGLSLALPESAAEGSSVDLTITRALVSDQPLDVVITGGNPRDLQVPELVTIPASQASTTVQLFVVDDRITEDVEFFRISATASGFSTASANLSVPANDIPNATLRIVSDTFSEAAGPLAASATIELNAPSDGLTAFALASSDQSAVRVPATAGIASGKIRVTFPVEAIDDLFVDGDQSATITVTSIDPFTGNTLAQVASGIVRVVDNDGPTLSLAIDRGSVGEGITNAAIGTVSRNTDTTTPLTVTFFANDADELTLPISVVIPAGSDNASFPIDSIDDGIQDGNRVVTVSAGAPGFADGIDSIIVADGNLPDLIISQVTAASTSALAGEELDISYTFSNVGVAAALGGWTQKIYLSSDAFVGDDQFAGQFSFTGPLADGDSVQRPARITLPEKTGTYWIVAIADANEGLAELRDDNNANVTATPVTVTAAWNATAVVDLDVSPPGAPVTITGQALAIDDATPLPNTRVRVHVVNGDSRRTINALTDANGDYLATFSPLARESGFYEIGAAHPGEAAAPVQDSFIIPGMSVTPKTTAITIREGQGVTGTVTITNLTPITLTNLQAQAVDPVNSLAIVATINGARSIDLGPNETIDLDWSATAIDAFYSFIDQTVRVSSDEGAFADFLLNTTIQPVNSKLVAEPTSLRNGVLRGDQKIVSFTLRNAGGRSTGPLRIAHSELPWMRLTTPSPLPSLDPGAETQIEIQLTPPASASLAEFAGAIVVNADDSGVRIPYAFRTISDAVGDLVIDCVDEFTFYADGAPHLEGATVQIFDGISGELVISGTTDVDGLFAATNLKEGWYDVRATAPDHLPFKATVLVSAGETGEVSAFLPREAVKYIWTVTPTTIDDVTKITIETDFETNVPMPVITVEPTRFDLAEFTDEITQVDVTITNHGLIAAQNFGLAFESHPSWSIEPLIEEVGDVAAKSSITIPVIFRKLNGGSRASGPCNIGGASFWELLCGTASNNYSQRLNAVNANPDCGGGSGGVPIRIPLSGIGGGRVIYGGGFGDLGTGGSYVTQPQIEVPDLPCDPCWLKLAVDCGGEFLGPLWGIFKCARDSISAAANGGEGTLAAIRSCAGAAAGVAEKAYAPYLSILDCAVGALECYFGGGGGGAGGGPGGNGDNSAARGIPEVAEDLQQWISLAQSTLVLGDLMHGSDAWRAGAENSPDVFAAWATAVEATRATDSPDDVFITDAEAATLLALPTPDGVDAAAYVARWNRSLSYWDAGITAVSDVPDGQSTDFIPLADFNAAIATVEAAEKTAVDAGFANLYEAVDDGRKRLLDAASGDGVCARVTLRLDQEAIVAREAFDATLELFNDTNDDITNLRVEVKVQDADGNDASELFGIAPPTINGLGAVDGSGFVAALGEGTASWLIIPSRDAAPTEPTTFSVSGTMIYEQDGETVTTPLAATNIEVHPTPVLTAHYFHERDVFSDDPHTDVVEPAIPYNLGIMLINNGNGTANNVRINSAQPRIIENEKGLLIDFEIIASEVNGQVREPKLNAEFGDLGPNSVAVGRWLLRSSLQGLFTDYRASFEHVSGLGNPRLSLFEAVEIHETNRVIPIGGGLFHFLVNDLTDVRDLPDTLYLPDGSTETVIPVISGTATPAAGPSTYTVAANLPDAGWSYLRLDDPGNGLPIQSITRSDGTVIDPEHYWQTDRTFIGSGLRPIVEDKLHLLDEDSTGSYEVVYGTAAPADDVLPESAVSSLPASSEPIFAVSWSGTDNTGILSYDVYVSTDDGPFQLWLDDTSLTGAIYNGDANTKYAFYSVAVDFDGNTETAPTAADAQTFTDLVNGPPVIAPVNDQIIAEGDVLSLQLRATDDDAFTWSLEPGAPAGMTLDADSGRLRWRTGESEGGSSTAITVRATDSADPPLSATVTFDVTVEEVNSPPEVANLTAEVAEGTDLALTVTADDGDLPAQVLTWELIAAPAGMTIEPTAGIISWTPEFDDAGSNEILVKVTDSGAPPAATIASVLVTVINTNRDPVAVADAQATLRDLPIQILPVLPNDFDPDDDAITFGRITSSAARGSVTNLGNGIFQYDPSGAFDDLSPGQVFEDRFRYSIVDPYGAESETEVTVRVSGTLPSLKLRRGWQLISLPVDTPSTKVVDILGPAYRNRVYTLVGGRAHRRVTDMQPLTVYWVNAPFADTIQLTGTVPELKEVNLPRGMNVFAPGIDTIDINDFPDVVKAYRYDGRRLRATRMLYPGRGYYVVTNSPTTITIRNAR